MKIACMFLAALLCLAVVGCGSPPQRSANDGSTGATGGSGITVFGTVDADITHSRNR